MAMRTIILALAAMFGGANAQGTLQYDYGTQMLEGNCPANTEDTVRTNSQMLYWAEMRWGD